VPAPAATMRLSASFIDHLAGEGVSITLYSTIAP
jgi:hypothetical protein